MMMMLRTTIVTAVVVLTVFSSIVVQVVEAESRIVGGNNAAKGQYPYYGTYVCVCLYRFLYVLCCVVLCCVWRGRGVCVRDERNREKEREGEREKRKEGSEIEKQTGVRWREREREREIMLMCCLFFIRLSIYFIRHEFIVVNVYSYLFLYLPHFYIPHSTSQHHSQNRRMWWCIDFAICIFDRSTLW